MPLPKPADLERDVVAGGSRPSPTSTPKILSRESDDVAAQFPGVWDRMLNSPAVSSAVDLLIEAVLEDGIEIVPAVQPPPAHAPDPAQQSQADTAREIADFVTRCIDRLSDTGYGIYDLCGELLMGLCYGCKAAEIILEPGTGIDAGRLVPARIAPKDGARFAFVVDAFDRLVGFVVREPGSTGKDPEFGQEVMSGKPESLTGFMPRQKMILFRNAGKNGDPRGESILRPAYNAFLLAEKLFPEWFRFLSLFTLPLIIGKAPPNAGYEPELDENGQPIENGKLVSVATKMRDVLVQLQNGTVAVLPFGSEWDSLKAEGNGQAFIDALEKIEKLIHLAILGTSRATLEAQHGSKADSGEAQTVLRLRIGWIRRTLAETLKRDLVKLLVSVNWGEDFLPLAPNVVLSRGSQSNLLERMKAYAVLRTAGILRDEHMPWVWADLGLPPGDLDAMIAEREERDYQSRLAAGEIGRLRTPGELPEDDAA
jgi:hypothetical protein